MYIIIAGGGIVGQGITRLLSKKHDLVVIEEDYDACEKITSKYGAVAIQGDATNINTLLEAHVEKADVAIGVMGKDAPNLLFCLLCKNYHVDQIFARMRDPQYQDAFAMAGATNIGHSTQMMVEKFVFDIENSDMRRVASLRNGKAVVAIITLKDHDLCINMTIQEIVKMKHFPEEIVIAGIFDIEKDQLVIPRGSTTVYANNQLFLVGTDESIKKAHDLLVK